MTTKNTKTPGKNKDKNEANNYHVQLISNRTLKALKIREEAFKQAHEADDDAELIRYVRDEAYRLGHTPRSGEIEGWSYLEERFGGWKELLKRAGLKSHGVEEPFRKYALFQEEYDRQAKHYAEHKKYKKQRSYERKIEQAERKKQQEAYLLEHPEARKKKKRKKSAQAAANPADENSENDNVSSDTKGTEDGK